MDGGDYTKSESCQWRSDLDCFGSKNSLVAKGGKANPPMRRWSVANRVRRSQVPHVHCYNIDTVGRDRELQDELNIEEHDHDLGMTSVSVFKGIYIQYD